MSERAVLTEMPEIHQFLDGFYLSRIGIRILIGRSTQGGQGADMDSARHLLWLTGK